VKKGQLLIELDATIAAADTQRYAHDLVVARLQILRARALLTALNTNLTPIIHRELNIPFKNWQEAQDQVRGLFQEYQARKNRIHSDLEKHQAELNTIEETIRKINHTLPYAQKRAQDFKDLSDKNFVSRHAWMEKDQIRLEQEADLAMQRSRSQEMRAAVKETQAQLQSLTTELRRQMLDAISEGTQKFVILQQELVKTTSRQHLMQLRAPIDGTVQQLVVNTIGGVVTPAQPLMLIVPDHHPIEIEALLENKDIGFVKKDQNAEIKIETFPYTRYGTIKGKVAHISQDAINDEKRGLTYLVHIQPERNKIQVDEKSVALSPGMVVSVEIKTGSRRVIEYFLNPLMQYANESLRER
jgi:hemolysin D